MDIRVLNEVEKEIQSAISKACLEICKYHEKYEKKADFYDEELNKDSPYEDWQDALYEEHCAFCPLNNL